MMRFSALWTLAFWSLSNSWTTGSDVVFDSSALHQQQQNARHTLDLSSSCSNETSAITTCLFGSCSQCLETAQNISTALSGSPPTSCQGVNDLACPLLNCCSSCSSQVDSLVSCLASVAGSSSLASCSLSCSGGSSGGSSSAPAGTSSPTASSTTSAPVTPAPASPSSAPVSSPVAPVSTPTSSSSSVNSTLSSCDSAKNDVITCATLHFCTSCIAVGRNLSSTTTTPTSCQEVKDLACPLADCCPKCTGKVNTLYDCIIQLAPSQLSSVCSTLNCNGDNSTNTTSGAAGTIVSTLPFMTTGTGGWMTVMSVLMMSMMGL